MRLLVTSCFLVLAGLPSLAQTAATTAPPSNAETAATPEMLPASLLQISETEAFSPYVLLVDKEKRKLTIFERNGENVQKVAEFPTDIGKKSGNKTARDDARTPEGIYFLERKLSPPEIPFNTYGDLAFTTSYPNLFDRRENKTGSGIWLHAVPDSVPLTRGSRGCVVVRNEVIKKLANYIKLNETPILIFDQVRYVTKEEHIKMRSELSAFVESWRQAWESQDVEKYMTFYDKDFKAPGFNYASWKAHKNYLKKRYAYIKVHLSQPYIITHHDQLIVKTLQSYESNQHVDYGVKTIYALKSNEGGYHIIREEWTPFSQKSVTEAIAKDNTLVGQHQEEAQQ